MATAAKAVIRITAVPDRNLKRVMNGTRKVAAESEKAITKATEQENKRRKKLAGTAARDAIRAAKQVKRERIKAEKDAARAATRAQAKVRREQERTAREAMRAAQKTARERIKQEERAARTIAKKRHGRKKAIAGGVIGGVVGAGYAAAQYSSQAQGRLGVSDPGDTVLTAKQITEQIIVGMTQAGKGSAEIKSVLERIDATAKETKVSQAKLAAAVVMGQETFSDIGGADIVLDNLKTIAQAARAAGGSDADPNMVAKLALSEVQAGNLSTGDVREVIMSVFAQAAAGAMEFGDLAGPFAPAIAGSAMKTGASGMEEMKQLNAQAQLLAKAMKKSPDEAATLMERFWSRIMKASTQDKLRSLGIDIADKETGELIGSPLETLEAIGKSPEMANPQTRQWVMQDILGEQAAGVLVKALQDDPMYLRSLTQVDPKEGSDLVDLILSRLDENPLSEVDAMNIKAQSVTLTGDLKLNELMLKAAKTRNELATENAVAYDLAGPAGSILGGVAGGGILASLGKIIFGGGGAGAGVTMGAGAGAGGAAGAAGAAGVTAGSGAGAAAGGLGLGGMAAGLGGGALIALAYKKLLDVTGITGEIEDAWAGLAPGVVSRSTSRGIGLPMSSAEGKEAVARKAEEARMLGEAVADAVRRKGSRSRILIELADGRSSIAGVEGDEFEFGVATGAMSEAP